MGQGMAKDSLSVPRAEAMVVVMVAVMMVAVLGTQFRLPAAAMEVEAMADPPATVTSRTLAATSEKLSVETNYESCFSRPL